MNEPYKLNIHDDSYWTNLYEHDYTGEDRKFDVIRNIMYAYEVAWIAEHKELRGSFLDVGCSYGNFFNHLPPDMKRIGLDIPTDVINQARTYHPDCEFYTTKLEDVNDQSFDFIQFRGVLQHMTDPRGNLKAAKELLADDGIIIITSLPDFSSIASRIYGKRFNFYLPHLTPNHFTSKSFKYLVESLGLKIIQQDSPYIKTPYSSSKDLLHFITNYITNKKSPPFYGTVKNYILK